jgi:hypothetical protein
MMRRLLATLGAMAIVAACGGASGTGDVGGPADGDVAADGTTSDGATSDGAPGTDGGGADATSDAAQQCTACKPDFCGCGQCTNEQVVCTQTPKPCPLGCASSCDLKPYTCGCAADRCVRLSPAPPQVVPCYKTLDCPPGNCCMPRSGVLQGACVVGSNCP